VQSRVVCSKSMPTAQPWRTLWCTDCGPYDAPARSKHPLEQTPAASQQLPLHAPSAPLRLGHTSNTVHRHRRRCSFCRWTASTRILCGSLTR
jgi:hypothetical protein